MKPAADRLRTPRPRTVPVRNCEAKFLGDHAEVKPSRIHGLGPHATRVICAGEKVNTRDTRGFRGYNHACDPNVRLVHDGLSSYGVALRNIEPGEELTVSYGFSLRRGCRCPGCTKGMDLPITFIPPFEYYARVIVRDLGAPPELDHHHLWVIRRMALGESAETTKVTLVRECKIHEVVQHPPTDPEMEPDIREITFPELVRDYELTGRRSTLRYLT